MAIYHLNARGCSPSTGAGAVRKAAYQSGQALVEERSGELCDYARKHNMPVIYSNDSHTPEVDKELSLIHI